MAALLPGTFRAFLAFMLAVIGLQATPAQPLPNQPVHGSAFSASTVELALPVRREVSGEVRLAAIPLPPSALAPVPVLADQIEGADAWPANRQTGPPVLQRPMRWSPAPRAPPALS